MMRAIVDAGVHDDEWCRAHTTGYEDLLERLDDYSLDRCAELCGVPAATIARIGCEFATSQPSLLRLGVGAQRHMGAPIAYRTIACLPALAGSWRHEGGGCSYVPVATISAVAAGEAAMRRPDLRPAPVRSINMSQLAARSRTPRSTRR
jgi:anaerobic selenocysteine-containing dehydrogenase